MDHVSIDSLRAAQAAAGHAWSSAVAAWVAIGVNVAGLMIIWRQLRSNQASVRAAAKGADAAATAARIALMSERPWIQHQLAEGLTIDLVDGALEISLEWSWTNVGHTPAIRVYQQLYLVPGVEAKLADAIDISRTLLSPGPTIFPGCSEESRPSLVLGAANAQSAETTWRVFVIVTYSIPGDSERRVTAAEYRLRRGKPAGQANQIYPALANSWHADIIPAVLSHSVHT